LNFGEVLEEMKKGPEHVFKRSGWKRIYGMKLVSYRTNAIGRGGVERRFEGRLVDLSETQHLVTPWMEFTLGVDSLLAEDWIRVEGPKVEPQTGTGTGLE